ncbi:nuclear RNA export factor 2 [Microplitis demolitor]|uniref:nuclear RNA export factor 2 n=1 Tax=Microplitis demolitor TaxID=69319 RepID=UPI0004CD63F7|nr:nuclear RNA export factor 2 [Microplitis demolitor]
MQSNIPLTPVQLDVSSALKLIKNDGMFKERTLMARNDAWHRIKILHGSKYDKEFVLKSILTAVEPADLIPVRYQSIGVDDTCFIARNCGPAIEKLCKNNLIIKIPNSDPLILVITLAFASIQDLKVAIQPLLIASLTKRYDAAKKSLNLKNFHRHEDIAKHVYCPLSQTRTFSHVLKLTKTALASFESLNLQNNDLACLAALESPILSSLKNLDLRNNSLMGIETLTPLRSLEITELWLDGNPLCENYSSASQYIESVKKYCPHLLKLDGIDLENQNIPPTVENYFPNRNVENLVKQFAYHFFIIHDQMDKSTLRGLYHKRALFSLTLNINSGTSRKNLGAYMSDNRNMANQSDLTRNRDLLYLGPDEIIGALKRLPRCLHDRTSFNYDVIFDGRGTVAVTVNGHFKIVNSGGQILSFNRTFILMAQPDDEFVIVNDQYHVDTSITRPISPNFEKRLAEDTHELTSMSPREKNEMVEKLINVTTMNREWAFKFLEETRWELKRAIINFINAYSSSMLPKDAF